MIFGNKRSESEILAKILNSAEEDTKKTKLLHNANISYTHFIKYFNFLIDKNFIEIKNGNQTGKVYKITDKGKIFLDNINSVLKQVQ
jgi:predicted transcriptional regulator